MSHQTTLEELLFRYMEQQRGDAESLTPDELQRVEDALQNDPAAKATYQSMRSNLTLLGSIEKPVPPSTLATRCLQATQDRPRAGWLSIPVLSVSTALAAVFITGLWLGSMNTITVAPMEIEPFQVLIQQQTLLTDELYAAYEEQFPEADAPWRTHLEALSQTTETIRTQYAAHRGDPIMEARLNAVIKNNIRMLGMMLSTVEDESMSSGTRIWQTRTTSI